MAENKVRYLVFFLCNNEYGRIITNGQMQVNVCVEITEPEQVETMEERIRESAIELLPEEKIRGMEVQVRITGMMKI